MIAFRTLAERGTKYIVGGSIYLPGHRRGIIRQISGVEYGRDRNVYVTGYYEEVKKREDKR